MKKIFLLFNLLIIKQLAISQGIIWEKTIEETFKKAKAKNKLVFMECYHPECHVCASLEPTFKTNELGDFYNKNFINFKLNLSDQNQTKFLASKHIRIPSYPLFTYFDASKNLIHIAEVEEFAPAKTMISIGQVVLDPEKRGSSYKKRYEIGERNQDFLINYAYISRVLLDTTKTIQLGNDLYEVFPKEQLSGQLSWLITKKLIMDIDNGFAQYWINHITDARKFETTQPDGEINTLVTIITPLSLYSKRGFNYSSAQVQKRKEELNLIGAGKYVSTMTWEYETRALVREGQPDKALDLVNKMANQFSNHGQSLVYIVGYLVDYIPLSKSYTLAQNLLEKAKPLSKTAKELAEWNYQSARVYQKLDDKNAAKNAIIEAKKQATIAKIDAKGLKKYTDLSLELR